MDMRLAARTALRCLGHLYLLSPSRYSAAVKRYCNKNKASWHKGEEKFLSCSGQAPGSRTEYILKRNTIQCQ